METAVTQAVTRFGPLRGVIHAAGIIDAELFCAVKDIQFGQTGNFFSAKVHGLSILEKVLEKQAPDFCLLTSSLASVLGGLGMATYTAATAFMDSFAYRHNQTSPVPWLTVNWDAWKITAEKYYSQNAAMAELAITEVEGAAVLEGVLALAKESITQVVISTSDLTSRIQKWLVNGQAEPAPEPSLTPQQSRPVLQVEYIAPRTLLEQKIAAVWRNVLGIDQIGVFDNFFELGGNSLVGTQLIADLNEALGLQIPAVGLYEGPTINSLSQMIEKQNGSETGEDGVYTARRSRGQRRLERMQQRQQQ